MDINIMNELRSALMEEKNDIEKYHRLAMQMKESNPRMASILCDIAKDEESHAKYIEFIIENCEKKNK